MGIRLFLWDISSPNSCPLCSLDNFFRHYNILTFQASPHVYCTPVTATVMPYPQPQPHQHQHQYPLSSLIISLKFPTTHKLEKGGRLTKLHYRRTAINLHGSLCLVVANNAKLLALLIQTRLTQSKLARDFLLMLGGEQT